MKLALSALAGLLGAMLISGKVLNTHTGLCTRERSYHVCEHRNAQLSA